MNRGLVVAICSLAVPGIAGGERPPGQVDRSLAARILQIQTAADQPITRSDHGDCYRQPRPYEIPCANDEG